MKHVSKFLLGFLIISLFVTIYQIPKVKATSTFGYETKGDTQHGIKGYILGTKFACPEAGTATHITAYIFCETAGKNVKFALYKASDASLVAYTEEHATTGSEDGNVELAVVWGGELTATDYYIVWWVNSALVRTYYTEDAAFDRAYDSETYNGFPNPWSQTAWGTYKYTIFCTYTPAGVGEYSEEFTETVSISASLYLWQAIFHKYTETITTTASLYSWREKTSFYTETSTVTDQSTQWIELARFFTETIIITETSSFAMEILIVITEFVETVTVDASLFLWRAIQHEFYETVTLTASLQALAEEFISFVEFPELIRFDADLYLTLPIIPPPEIEITTFGTVAFVIAIIALALGIVALRKRE